MDFDAPQQGTETINQEPSHVSAFPVRTGASKFRQIVPELDVSLFEGVPILEFPLELVFQVLEHIVGPTTTVSIDSRPIYDVPSAVNDDFWTPVIVEPNPVVSSFLRCDDPLFPNEVRRLLLQTCKRFDRADILINVHIALLGHRLDLPPRLIDARRTGLLAPYALHSPAGKHGLEHIELDFTMEEYVAFFDVNVPPFDSSDWQHRFSDLRGGWACLQHTEHLVLDFGGSYEYLDAWYDCEDERWEDARCRPTCTKGHIVDWILSYAWHHIKHIKHIEIRPDGVQDWAWRKWMGHVRARKETVFEPDLEAIESWGRGLGTVWDPVEHYPPKCECDVLCYRWGCSSLPALDWGTQLEADASPLEGDWLVDDGSCSGDQYNWD